MKIENTPRLHIIQIVKINYLLVLFFAINHSVCSQNPGLLNLNTQNYNFNPAFTGDHPYDWNIYNSISNLYTGFNYNLQTFNLAGDYQFYLPPDKISLGFNYLQRKLNTGPLSEKMINFTIAFHKRFRSHIFHVGIQPGISGQSLLVDQLLFPDQYDRSTGVFNSNIGTSENIMNSKVNKFNLNAGLLYTLLKNNRNMKIGFAMFNIVRPNLSFTDQKVKLPIRYVSSFGIDIPIQKGDVLRPFSLITWYSDQVEWTGGVSNLMNADFFNSIIPSFSAGAFIKVRNHKQPTNLICQIGFKYKRFNFEIAYSKPIFYSQNLPQQWQTIELSVVYNGFLAKVEKLKIPCNFF